MNEIIFWNDIHIHFCEIILDINEHARDPPLLTLFSFMEYYFLHGILTVCLLSRRFYFGTFQDFEGI